MSSTEPIVIGLIGAVTISRGRHVVDPRSVGGPRCVEVFAYLTSHRHREISHDELGMLLWEDSRPRSWNSMLRGVISKVRDVLVAAGVPGTALASRAGMVRLNLPPDATVDLDTVRDACRRSDAPPMVRADRARQALARLSDPLLVGANGAWVDDVRREFDDLRLTALEIDAAASLELGDFTNAVSSAEALLVADPLRESAYRIAMRGYVALGDRGKALGAAARCRRVLADKLGVSPSPATEELYLSVLEENSSRAASEPTRPVVPALYGREAEMDEISTALAAAEQGRSQFVLISGVAGVGKTSLVSAVAARARSDGLEVVMGRCSDHAAVPYEPFTEAVTRDLDDRGVAGAREWLRENGTEILGVVPGAARRFGDLIPTRLENNRAGASAAVAQWLTGPARRSTTVLIIDDLHWASAATMALVEHLAQSIDAARLCIIATVREDDTDAPDLARAVLTISRVDGFHEIVLGGLSVAAVRSMVQQQNSPLDPAQLVERTTGSALLIAAAVAAHERDPAGTLPFTVADAVRSAGLRIGPDALGLLSLCSVIGVSMPRLVLRTASTIDSDICFAEALDELMSVNFLLPGRTDDDLTMRHALVQRTVYDALPAAERGRLHSAVARALVRIGANSTADESARIAYHFGRSLDADRPEAARYARLAGDSAYAVAAYEDAVEYYRAALRRMLPLGDSPDRCRLLIDLGRAQRKCIDRTYRSTLLDAIAMARRLGDTDLQVDATLADTMSGAVLFQIFEPLPERLDSLHDALHILEDTGRKDSAATARVLIQLAAELTWTDDWRERRALLDRAVSIAEAVGDDHVLDNALIAMLWALLVPECWDVQRDALARLDSRRPLTGRRDPTVATILVRTRLGFGDLAGAAATLDGVTRADVANDPEMTWVMVCSRFGVDVAAGLLVRAESVLDRICAPPDAAVGSHTYGRHHPSIMVLRTLRGDLRDIAVLRDEMSGMYDLVPAFRPAVALSLADIGDMDSARDIMGWYDEQRIAAIPSDILWLMTMAFLARAAAATRNTLVCTEVYRRLLPYADLTVMLAPSIFGVVHHHLADVSLAVGDLERAGRHLHSSRVLHLRRGYVGWNAEDAYLGLKIEHARTGRVSERAVRSARDRADAIGATAVRRRIDAFCASVEERPF